MNGVKDWIENKINRTALRLLLSLDQDHSGVWYLQQQSRSRITDRQAIMWAHKIRVSFNSR